MVKISLALCGVTMGYVCLPTKDLSSCQLLSRGLAHTVFCLEVLELLPPPLLGSSSLEVVTDPTC